MASGPTGVDAVKLSLTRSSFANCRSRKAWALACPGLPTQRGPVATNSLVYVRARSPSKRGSGAAVCALVAQLNTQPISAAPSGRKRNEKPFMTPVFAGSCGWDEPYKRRQYSTGKAPASEQQRRTSSTHLELG